MAIQSVVMVVGAFDPVHEGHIEHILKAAELGDRLIVVTHTKEALIQKKGYEFQSLRVRIELLRGVLSYNKIDGEVLVAIDDYVDGKTYQDGIGDMIRTIRPDIFAKGGDRVEGTLPQDELDACEEVGCKIVYGIGRLLNSSSKMVEKIND